MRAVESVTDAESRLNIVEWGNTIRYQSLFQLRGGVDFWAGPVANGPLDMFVADTQIYVPPPLDGKLRLIASKFRRVAQDRIVLRHSGSC